MTQWAARLPSEIDHGNHMPGLQQFAAHTPLLLLHFHTRSNPQLVKKAINNWRGLGHPTDVSGLRSKLAKQPGYIGGHYAPLMRGLLDGTWPNNRTIERLYVEDRWNVSLAPFVRAITDTRAGRRAPPPYPPYPPGTARYGRVWPGVVS